MQNIPSHEKIIRMMFTAQCIHGREEVQDDMFSLNKLSDVMVDGSWVNAKELEVGMRIEDQCVEKLEDLGDKVIVHLCSC